MCADHAGGFLLGRRSLEQGLHSCRADLYSPGQLSSGCAHLLVSRIVDIERNGVFRDSRAGRRGLSLAKVVVLSCGARVTVVSETDVAVLTVPSSPTSLLTPHPATAIDEGHHGEEPRSSMSVTAFHYTLLHRAVKTARAVCLLLFHVSLDES